MVTPAPFFVPPPLRVIPANAGTHGLDVLRDDMLPSPAPQPWVPAFAGMTDEGRSTGMRDTFIPCVYLLASRRHGTLYVGVTSNLLARVMQHQEGLIPGFTKRYGVKRLVWYEAHETMEAAILREKRIKEWRRAWKIDLIQAHDEGWTIWRSAWACPACRPCRRE